MATCHPVIGSTWPVNRSGAVTKATGQRRSTVSVNGGQRHRTTVNHRRTTGQRWLTASQWSVNGREAHLLEDKQIPSIGAFDEVTLMAFEGNTRDLGSIGEGTNKTTTLHQSLLKNYVHCLDRDS
ncbi:hypothetical protein Tco_1380900 [Tanacetum coccineum]